MVQRANGLHGTLAEGLRADHQSAAVTLDGTGKNLRGRSAHAVNQNHQRAIVNDGRVFVVQYLDIVVGVADLYRRALINKQAHQIVGLVQGTATVVTQIHHDAIHAVAFEFVDQPAHIPGGALVVGIAGLHGLEVGIEGGDGNHADAVILAFAFKFDDFTAGALLLQFYLVPTDVDGAGHAFISRIGRDHFEGNCGVAGATDQVDHFVQAPTDHIHRLFVFLRHGDDAIGRLELALFGRRPAGHQADNLGVLVVRLEHRADPFQRKAHVDIEVFRGARREVSRVGVPHTGKRVHVSLEGVLTAGLIGAFELAFVPAAQVVLYGVIVCTVQALRQNRVLDAFDPELIQGCFVGLPGRFRTIYTDLVVGLEVELVNALVDNPEGKLQAFGDALLDQIVNIKARLELAGLEGRSKSATQRTQRINILLSEVNTLAVEVVQVGIKDITRELIADAQVAEMGELQLTGDEDVGSGLVNRRRYRLKAARVLKLCLQAGQSGHQKGQAKRGAQAGFLPRSHAGASVSVDVRNAHRCIPGDTGCLGLWYNTKLPKTGEFIVGNRYTCCHRAWV